MRVLSYYLAGWHIKPKGVKKPSAVPILFPQHPLNVCCRYNPILGEFFRCRYDYANGTHGFYIAEQGKFYLYRCILFVRLTLQSVSHHPPISAFFYISPANRVSIIGELRPKSKFLGNSVSTTMEGENRVRLLGAASDGGER